MITKIIQDRQKKPQNIDQNNLDSLNAYLQQDNQPIIQYPNIKISIGMPIILEQQNETQGNTHQSVISQSQANSPDKELMTIQDIKLNIRIVFKFYTAFGNRHNTRFLKCNKFIKMLQDAQIIPQKISNKDSQILYASQTKNTESLTLEQFQNLIPKLAIILYPQFKIHQAFLTLYNEYLSILSQKILNFTEFGQQIQFVLQPINHQFKEIIMPFIQQLANLHKSIFQDQSSNFSKVQWQFMQFLTLCDILPNCINQSQAQIIFDNIQIRQPLFNFPETENYLFSFNYFVECLIIISKAIPNLDEFIQFQQLLDKIENSDSFSKYLFKLNRTQSDKIKLFQNLEKSRTFENQKQQSIQLITNYQNNNYNRLIGNSNSKSNDSRANISLIKQSRTLLEIDQQTLQSLKNLFEYYAKSGEPSNIYSLKKSKFNQLLQHTGIINNLISLAEADMIYSKLCGAQSIKFQQKNNQLTNGRMTFNHFQLSIELIAEKFSIEINDLIQQYFKPLEKQISDNDKEYVLQILVELLQNDQIIQLYEIIQPVFNWYFQEYSKYQKQKQVLYLSEFLKFCQDFQLSNILISQTQLTQIFYSIASLNQEGSEYSDIIYLDRSQFVETISVIAVILYQTIPNQIERIVYLLERIFQSQNTSKIYIKQNKLQAKFYNIIDEIKFKFLQNQLNKQDDETYNFEDLINSKVYKLQ